MILFLLACSDPPLLDAVQTQLGEDAVETGGDSIRRFVAISQLAGEIWIADAFEGKTWDGGGSLTLGVDPPVVVDGAEEVTFTFTEVGLEGESGALVFTTDVSMRNFAFTYTWLDRALDGDLVVTAKADASGGPIGIVAGRAAEVASDGTAWALTIAGPQALPGIGYSEVTPLYPVSGSVRWDESSDGVGRKIVLDDASEVDLTGGAWPGLASDEGWETQVDVPFP